MAMAWSPYTQSKDNDVVVKAREDRGARKE